MEKVSNMLKDIVNDSKFNPYKDVAFLLGKTEQSIRNKYSLDNFTFREIMMILSLCDYDIEFVPHNKDKSKVKKIDAIDYLEDDEIKNIVLARNNQVNRQLTIFDNFMDNNIDNIPYNVKDDVIDQMIRALESKKSNP